MSALWIRYIFDSFLPLTKEETIGLIEYFENNNMIPLKYGDGSTRPKYEYDTLKKNEVVNLCYELGYICLKGKNFLAEFDVNEAYAKPYIQQFRIKVTNKINPNELIKLGVDLCKIFKACYGYARLNDNADSWTPGRHIVDCLFGFSWLNIFGKPYIDMWGEKKISDAPAIILSEAEYFLIMLSESPFIELEEIRNKNIELKKYFGYEYFYNRDFENQKTTFKSIREIEEYKSMINNSISYSAPDFHRYYDFQARNGSFYAVAKGLKSILEKDLSESSKENVIIEEI